MLPHLGFAYQELGQSDKAIAAFDEAHKLAPKDQSIAGYLIQANLSANDTRERSSLSGGSDRSPNDLRLARLEAQAFLQNG